MEPRNSNTNEPMNAGSDEAVTARADADSTKPPSSNAPRARHGSTPDPGHTNQSSTREKVLEHIFLGELLRALWRKGYYDVEVLRAEVDKGGYDLVIECNGTLRHIQLKSSYRTAKTNSVKININLANKPGGCVVWMLFDPASIELGPFLWFGGDAGEKLPTLGDKIGKHTKGNKFGQKAERPNIRVLSKSKFVQLETMNIVAEALFGTVGSFES